MVGECGRRRSRQVVGWARVGAVCRPRWEIRRWATSVMKSAMMSVGGRAGAPPSRSWVVAVLLPRREYRRYQKHAESAEAEANSRSVLLWELGRVGRASRRHRRWVGWALLGRVASECAALALVVTIIFSSSSSALRFSVSPVLGFPVPFLFSLRL